MTRNRLQAGYAKHHTTGFNCGFPQIEIELREHHYDLTDNLNGR
jgi:hypothetical protein